MAYKDDDDDDGKFITWMPPGAGDDEKIAMAKEQISALDAQRGIEAGSFDNPHVAAALRQMADEYDAAEPGEHWWGKYEASEEGDDTEGYDTLKTPKRKSHGRMKRIARGEEKEYARKTAGYTPN